MNYLKLLSPFFIIIAALSFVSTSARVNHADYKLIIFEGSDWCVQCIRLEEKVLSDSTFLKFVATAQIDLERIDFPQRKRLSKDIVLYNDKVAEKYAFDGTFPTLLLSNTETEAVHKISYSNQDPEELIALLRAKIASAR